VTGSCPARSSIRTVAARTTASSSTTRTRGIYASLLRVEG
jgi:hypothetical protein